MHYNNRYNWHFKMKTSSNSTGPYTLHIAHLYKEFQPVKSTMQKDSTVKRYSSDKRRIFLLNFIL